LPLSIAHELDVPAEIEDVPRAAASAACGAGTSKNSPAASENSAAGMTRRRSTARSSARRAGRRIPVVLADIVLPPQHGPAPNIPQSYIS
jgi:hypothetical protein